MHTEHCCVLQKWSCCPPPGLACCVLLAGANPEDSPGKTDPLELGGCKTSLLPQLGDRPHRPVPPLASRVRITGQEEEH